MKSTSEEFKEIFNGKTILITGGTGFLGVALIKEILNYNPKSIRVFGRDEAKHHKVQELFKNEKKLRHFIGDVRDYERLLKATNQADVVIHAAALKRLDMIEYNVEEAIKTNILGTSNVVRACLKNNVGKVVFISSDKACSPVNTYGACKFVGERIFTESNYNKGKAKTIFTVVRYGNVLESTGSVIPFFEAKIKNCEEIPLTDTRMTRFIISPKGAVQLVFKALKYGIGGEVFIPKLHAFKITDLIEILKEKHNCDNKVKIIGLRPGEKIHELMINDSEIPRTYDFKDCFVITSAISKYQDIKKAKYLLNWKKVEEDRMSEYSSKDVVISKEEVQNLFRKLNLL